jgi:iron(III) transport system ATP-binding protein
MTEALRIAGLTKAFGDRALLTGVDLVVPRGELVAVLGASGSGKTTLLRLIAGFEHADAGAIAIGGVAVAGRGLHLPPERRRVGYVAQEGALFPHLSVGANVLFGLPRTQRRSAHRAAALLESVGLPASYAGRAPQDLSGGEQQRVALARALAPAPRLVLLDEPFSALDAALRVETRGAVAAALAAADATALLVTHDQSEALSMGGRVAVLRDGALVQVATPELLYRRPVDAELARFVGDAVLLPGTVTGGRVRCALGDLPLLAAAAEGPATVLLRPEQIRLTEGTAATVARVTYYGHDASVALCLDAGGPALTARVFGHAAPRPGARVGVVVDGPAMAYPRAE